MALFAFGCGGGDPTEPQTSPSGPASVASAGADLACADGGRFVPIDTVVFDVQTHLYWQRDAAPVPRTQADAIDYCERLALDNRFGWRVPTQNELGALCLRSTSANSGNAACTPMIDQSAFPATPSAEFWSSETTSDGSAGMCTDFTNGRARSTDVGAALYVRCVLDPIAE